MNKMKRAEWVLRFAVAGEFIGHGVFALGQKAGWVGYFTAIGISSDTALLILPLIGAMDILLALIILYRPVRPLLLWMALWAFITAAIRPIAGEPVWDFIERFANIGAPLALYHLMSKK